MKIVILSAFPLLDRHAYKKQFLKQLVERRYVNVADVTLVYGSTTLRDYWIEARKFGVGQSLQKARRAQERSEEMPGGTVGSLARRLGLTVRSFSRLNSPSCLEYINSQRPDVIHNFTGLYLPPALLNIPKQGVVGGHYAQLPAVRGSDTVRWTIYLNEPMFVCHMILAAQMDMGDIIRSQPITVQRGDTIADIYRKCQIANAEGQLEVLDRIAAGQLARVAQRRDQGGYFYRMGSFLQHKVDDLLHEQRYHHYA